MKNPPLEVAQGALLVNVANAQGVRAYKGIPFAAPPVGRLRWRPPQPPLNWRGVRNTKSFGKNAPQRVVFSDIDPFTIGVSEDCLYLNVWTTAEPGDALPVFFWIHGGGFAVGSGSEPRYDGTNLANQGIVVVTVNTRLNALGFLAHPELTAETGSSGNFAMLDLIMALEWVKTNISEFGGNPGAITIGGESAGSMAVSLLMSSSRAKGLFHRTIGESGAWFPSPERPMRDLAAAELQGQEFAAKLGAKSAADLRSVPIEKILDANPGLGFWPVTDGIVIPAPPPEIFSKGQQSDVPMLAGWNKDEGFNFDVSNWGDLKGKPYDETVAILFPNDARKILQHYASPRDLGGDLVINHGAWRWIEAHRETAKSDIYRYRFDHAPKTPKGWFPRGAKAGAFHSCEIPYVFDTLKAMPWLIDKHDQQVADLTSGYWINFIKTGSPNGSGLPHWPSYREDVRPVMIIDSNPRIVTDIDRERHHMLLQIVLARK
jgi:para-nitrobenzyl esterase